MKLPVRVTCEWGAAARLQGNTPPLTWQTRICIACEMASGLLFLHNCKPEAVGGPCANAPARISDVYQPSPAGYNLPHTEIN